MDYNFYILLAPVYFAPVLFVSGLLNAFEAFSYLFSFSVGCVLYAVYENMLLSSLFAAFILILCYFAKFAVKRLRLRIKRKVPSFIVVSCGSDSVTFFDEKGIYTVEGKDGAFCKTGNVIKLSLEFFEDM